MEKKPWTREHIRASVYGKLIYLFDNSVKSGQCLNVSEGGAVVEVDSPMEMNTTFSILFLLADLPDFFSHTKEQLFRLKRQNFKYSTIRGQITNVRKEQNSGERSIYGCKFAAVPEESKESIDTYVKRYSRNLVFVLNLFESLEYQRSDEDLARYLCGLMGHDSDLPLNELRQKVLHDYNNFE